MPVKPSASMLGAALISLFATTVVLAQATPSITLTLDRTYHVGGSNFDPTSWIWITVDDDTDGSRLMDGPDAFQPDSDGSFRVTGEGNVSCAHTITARAWVLDVVVATSTATAPACASAALAADPEASPAVQALVASLHSAPQQSERRLIIGQALRGWAATRAEVEQPVTSLTGAGLPAPKLLELELSEFERDWGLGAAWQNELYGVLGDHAALGGYVGLTYHMPNPFGDGVPADLAQLLAPANGDPAVIKAQEAWRGMLDKLVAALRRLQDTGAIVFLRPLHEANGGWFWYGDMDHSDEGHQLYKSLWRSLFEYVTIDNDIHNVVWVYAANRNYGGIDPTKRYPGSDVVDIVGLDIYHDDLLDAEPGEPGYAAMVALGKPFAITEYGSQQAYTHWQTGEFIWGSDGNLELPNDEVISTIESRYPATVLATAWYSTCRDAACQNGKNWQISDKRNPAALLNDPWAITR